MTLRSRLALALTLATLVLSVAPARGEEPDPLVAVSPEDIAAVLGGSWGATIPEPGALFYEEDGGARRTVQVYLWPANGKTVAQLADQLAQEKEPVESVSGVGEAALYRPQRNEATAEKKNKAGELYWLTVTVQGAQDAAETRAFALELAKRGSTRF